MYCCLALEKGSPFLQLKVVISKQVWRSVEEKLEQRTRLAVITFTSIINFMQTLQSLHAEIEKLRTQLEQANAENQLYKSMLGDAQSSDCIYSKAQLYTLVHGFQYALLLENDQRKIVMANDRFCELFAIPVSADTLIGSDCSQSAEQVKHLFEESELFVARIHEILTNQEVVTAEEIAMKNGRFLLRDYIPVKGNHGHYLGHYWVYQDITERKNAEKWAQRTNAKLDMQKEFYEDILNSIPSDIAALSPDHVYMYVNPAGIADSEIRRWIIGKDDYQYCAYRNRPVSIADSRRERFEIIKSTGKQLEWEEKLTDSQGNNHYFLRKLYPVMHPDGSMKMALGYGMNITERKRIEEELKQSEELYRLVIDATNDGIWDWDIASGNVFFNNRLKQMFGYEENEFAGHISMWYNIMHPEDLPIAQAILREHLEKDAPFYYKLRFFHKDGSVRWIMCRGFALRDETHKPYRMLGSYTDITDAKETEEAFKRAKEIAEETSKSKEIFLANMSHEIRTPLNGIIGLSRLLAKTTLDKSQSEYLEAIRYSADNLLVIINDILDLAKIEAGKLVLEEIGFDAIEIAENALKSLTYKAEEKGIRLVGNFQKDKYLVNGDPYRLTQILTNLLNNAIKFTQNGTVELIIQAKVQEDIKDMHFEVKDTGIGIPENKLDTIFESFTQAQSDTTRKYGGTGLGLSICKSLIEMQGGTIAVQSEFGHGSTFMFDLRYKKGVLKRSEVEELTEFMRHEKVHILLAEDNEINQFLACELIKSWGMQVETASNGQEAIEKWAANDYDLILMDIQMPELGGVEATLEIRNRGLAKSNIPIVALTANVLKGQKERFIGLGMNDYISKPFNEMELYNKILALLPEELKNGVPKESAVKERVYDFHNLHLITNGNKEFEKKLMGIFIDTVPTSLHKLENACLKNDKSEIAITAHKLKTTINAMAIDQLRETIQKLEEYANAKKPIKELSDLSMEIVQTLTCILDEFKGRLA